MALGVYETAADVPLRTLREAGVPVALGADDPLLFGSRLLAQYDTPARCTACTTRSWPSWRGCSVRGSAAPDDVRPRLLAGIDDWLAPR